jgi:AraC-like DNA-binding protein
MMRDLRSPPFIADVAKTVGISQRKLIEIFREVFGATPLQCFVQWRLEQARLLLQSGNLSVKQVSYMVGYNYESNFSLAFTRYFGLPPSSLNRQCSR